jgi:hypothetical protein
MQRAGRIAPDLDQLTAKGQYWGVSLDGEAERHRPITSGQLGMNGLSRAPM